jgi:hypothetical protein
VPPAGTLTEGGETVTTIVETTLTVTGEETAPGPGFATVTLALPNWEALPVAVIRVEETKFVDRGDPFQSACAPLTKRLPVSVKVNGPGGNGFGATPVR